ncbi:MAG: DHHA1 domain-containing protein, partial [Albidovulum sp.]
GDSASAAGVRRIEALTGQAALDHLRAQDGRLSEVAVALKANATDVPVRVKALLDERKALTNELAQLRRELAMGGSSGQGPEARDIGGIKFMPQVISGVSGKDLPGMVDELKTRLGSGVVLIVADTGGKAAVAAGVTADLTDRISAVNVVKAAAAELGGSGGGGRADMAQAGGTDPTNSDAAIEAAAKAIKDAL